MSDAMKVSSTGASRARVQTLVDELERGLLSRNINAVHGSIRVLKTEVLERAQVAAIEEGALHALVGTLNYASRDAIAVEGILQTVAGLGKRVALSGRTVPIAALLRFEGLSTIMKVSKEHKTSEKICRLVVIVLLNSSVDELGARIVTNVDAPAYLLEMVRRYLADRTIVLQSLTALANMCIFHLAARAMVLASERETLATLLAASTKYHNDAEVLEQALCIMCMLSTGKTGADSLLKFRRAQPSISDDNPIPGQTSLSSSPEVVSVAMHALRSFAIRSFQRSVDESKANAAIVESPLSVLKTGLQRLTATGIASPASPGVMAVVTSNERRMSAWALMLLHNLALESADATVRREILQGLVQQQAEDARELFKIVVEAVRALALESSENIQEVEPMEPTSVVEMIACAGDDLQDGSVLSVVANLFSLQESTNDGGHRNVTPEQLLMQIATALEKDFSSSFSGHHHPLPVSPSSSRLITFLFAIFSHPYAREKLSPDAFELASSAVLDILRSGKAPEYFTVVSKALESAIGTRESTIPLLPYRSVPAMLQLSPLIVPSLVSSSPLPVASPMVATPTKAKPSPTAFQQQQNSSPATTPGTASVSMRISSSGTTTPGGIIFPEGEFALFEWRSASKEVCRQITLRMERLYAAINPFLLGVESTNNALSTEREVERFLAFHTGLVRYFKMEILGQTDSRDRATLIECLIDVAHIAAQDGISNVDLTIACLEALESPSIARLDVSWKKVRVDALHVFDQLKRLTQFADLGDLVQGAPPLIYRDAAVPFLLGCVRALFQLPAAPNNTSPITAARRREALSARYMCLNWWLPRISNRGDWHLRAQMFTPLPAVQMVLSRLVGSNGSFSRSSPSSSISFPMPDEPAKAAAEEDNREQRDVDDQGRRTGSPSLPPPAYSHTITAASHPVDYTEEDLLQFSMAREPPWALEQAKVEESVMVHLQVERILAEEKSLEGAALLALRREVPDEKMTERYGLMSKRLTAELLKRDDFKVHRKRLEPVVRACVERIILAPTMARLFIVSMEHVKQKETQLNVTKDQLRTLGFERTCELLSVPERLKLPWRSAIASLNIWSCGMMDMCPSTVLSTILSMKDGIYEEAKVHDIRDMTADDLLPVVSLIIVQSECKTLCAACHFLRAFYGDYLESGEAAYYFVTIESAIDQLRVAV